MQLRAQAEDTQGAGQASFRGYISVVTAVLGVGRGVRGGGRRGGTQEPSAGQKQGPLHTIQVQGLTS